jgi:ribonuclease P protein component
MQRPFRLRRGSDFTRLRAQGQRWSHPLVSLTVAPNALPHNRYGFVVSRRQGNAIARNRARRLMREAVRQSHARLRPGFDVVAVARNGISDHPYSEIKEALDGLFRRAGLWADAERPGGAKEATQ